MPGYDCPRRSRRNSPATGAAETRADLVSSSTAKAMFPWNPTNQAARRPPDASGELPTCPYTGAPATSAARPRPSVTVERISVRRADTTCVPNGTVGVSPGSGGLVTSMGGRQVPDCTTAAVMAMASGLTWTLPSPMESSASSAWPVGDCMVPAKALTGNSQGLPRPKPEAADCNFLADSFSERPAKAVPHAFAKSVRNEGRRRGSGGSLVKFWPPTGFEGPHGIGAFTSRPVLSRAAVETIVNAWPAG